MTGNALQTRGHKGKAGNAGMKIHHIGYLVKRLEKASDAFKALGYAPMGEAVRDSGRGVDILFMEKDGYAIELVSPFTKESVVAGLMKTYKNAPYHICYESEDFAADMVWLEANGYMRMDEPKPAPAIGDKRVVFFMSPALGMIELLELS